MPKPWADKDAVPYKQQSSSDGGPASGTHQTFTENPGEGGFRTPNPNPGGDTASREPGGKA